MIVLPGDLNIKDSICILLTGLFSALFIAYGCNPRNGAEIDKKRVLLNCDGLTAIRGMSCIPGGYFIRGNNRKVRKLDSGRVVRDEAPEMKIMVTTFYLDVREVTVKEYDRCVFQKGCGYARTNYGRPYLRPDQPKLGISWYQARAYCKYYGKRLPTETEWEKGARGVSGDLYPWGNDPADCNKAIIRDKKEGRGCGKKTTWATGSRPAFRYGLFDMAGNAHEWVNDWYSRSYKKCGRECNGPDPKGPCKGRDNCPGHLFKVVRGGSWWWPGPVSIATHRRPHFPGNKPYHHFGFRCAKSATDANRL